MLRTRFEENLGWLLDHKNIGLGFMDSNPDSSPYPDIKVLGEWFKSLGESFRRAAGYPKLR